METDLQYNPIVFEYKSKKINEFWKQTYETLGDDALVSQRSLSRYLRSH